MRGRREGRAKVERERRRMGEEGEGCSKGAGREGREGKRERRTNQDTGSCRCRYDRRSYLIPSNNQNWKFPFLAIFRLCPCALKIKFGCVQKRKFLNLEVFGRQLRRRIFCFGPWGG
jgi:hypothetical protein